MNEEVRASTVIRTPDQRLRVFALRLTPVLFETGARPHPPRDLYRAYLAQSDIFIGVYWQRYGQLNPECSGGGKPNWRPTSSKR